MGEAVCGKQSCTQIRPTESRQHSPRGSRDVPNEVGGSCVRAAQLCWTPSSRHRPWPASIYSGVPSAHTANMTSPSRRRRLNVRNSELRKADFWRRPPPTTRFFPFHLSLLALPLHQSPPSSTTESPKRYQRHQALPSSSQQRTRGRFSQGSISKGTAHTPPPCLREPEEIPPHRGSRKQSESLRFLATVCVWPNSDRCLLQG